MKTMKAGQLLDNVAVAGNKVRKASKGGEVFYYKPTILTNILPNGGFETNIAGWFSNCPGMARVAQPIPIHNETGSWVGRVSGNFNASQGGPEGNRMHITITPNLPVVEGHIYYIRGLMRKGDTTTTAVEIHDGVPTSTVITPIISFTEIPIVDIWHRFDALWMADTNSFQLSMHVLHASGQDGTRQRVLWFDNFMVIDLTQSYGAGYELRNINLVRQIVSNLGGYWNGTVEY